ncbi:PDZ domain-containing protein [Clostridium sp. LIBA-8841]|uniref:PDZ domain-containing protein n=1 Tax=Clostridium sp. LIBA-8841 TaxID=2987530 RepID=UPI002AC4CD2E|nr:PDZ domain-containing protein [Clostridium sp. LIBA-8841]MDZ5254607.1 PDZ domain-containing protein [Clostridium sp. LIBA-8841]
MNLLIENIRAISYALISPTLSLMLIVIAILFYFKNRKIAFMQKLMLGRSVQSPLEMTLLQSLMGILGGVIASLLLSFLGVTFEDRSLIDIILTVSVFSIVYKNRFIKIPYIAPVLGVIGVLLNSNAEYLGNGFSFSINLTSIIALIGVFSIVEGILTMIDGDKGYLPIFTQKDGELVGGFSFRRFWALPVCLLVVLGTNSGLSIINEVKDFPQWLPFFYGEKALTIMSITALGTIAAYGVTSYESSTFTQSKRRKTLSSGLFNIVYGILVIILAYLLRENLVFTIILIVLVPLLYELRLNIERKLEVMREPLYFSNSEEICILDVLPNSIAYTKGLRSGDKIIKVNGETPKNEKEVFMAIKKNFYGVDLEIRKNNGTIEKHIITGEDRGKLFGVVLVPKGVSFDREIDELLEKLRKANNDEEAKK